jgi:CMP-N-acetylneuraminic acid synthetase
MKTIAIVPIKLNSERVKGKNFRIINGIPLYRYLCDKLVDCNFDEIYIDSDSEEIKNYCQKMGYKYIERLKRLSDKNANGNDLLAYHTSIINADFYFQLFVTAPLLSIDSINDCIDILKNNNDIDSIFTSREHYSWYWFDGKPINYDPKILPRSQDAKPVISETTGLYGIKNNYNKEIKYRIGNKPYIYNVSDEESIDLDTNFDFLFLEYYVQQHLHSTK